MRIYNIRQKKGKDSVALVADIQFAGEKTQELFFRIPSTEKRFLATDASPFLAVLLLPCMKRNEAIEIDGFVSEKLFQNTKKIMDLMEKWNAGFNRVTVSVKGTTRDKGNKKFTASFFSGGVDSFYTYLKHKKTNDQITHFLLVHGFDIPLQNRSFFKTVEKRVRLVAKEEGVKVIAMTTNAAEIVEPKLVWDWSHGGALASVALAVRSSLKTAYISSAGVARDQLFPYGTHPDFDFLWSTETLSFVHDGCEHNRFEKIRFSIAKSPLALRHLRVCCQNRKGKYNCSNCFKCLTTMLFLECADALKNSGTFVYPLDLEKVRNMYYDYEHLYNLNGEQQVEFLKNRTDKKDLRDAILESLEKSRGFSLKKTLMQYASEFDQKYNKRRFYTFIFQLSSGQDRGLLFKTLFRYGFIK